MRGTLTRDHDRIPISSKADTVDPPKVPAPPPQRARGGHVPQEHLLIPANAGEAGIVRSDGEVEDLVAVRRVRLDEPVGRRADLGGIVQPYRAVGGTGQDLIRRPISIVPSDVKRNSIGVRWAGGGRGWGGWQTYWPRPAL